MKIYVNPTIGAEIKKKRPCVLIGATPINKARRTIVVIPLSTASQARPPLTISVTCLEKQAIAVCDQIRPVDKTRLISQAGTISKEDLKKIEEGLRQVVPL